MTIPTLIKIFIISFAITFCLTPVSIFAARKIGAVAKPRDARGRDGLFIPRFGGMAIVVSSTIVIAVNLGSFPGIRATLIAGICIFLIGTIDDIIDLPALVKFFLELLVASTMYFMGIRVRFITNFFGDEQLFLLGDVACFIVTVLWIVGITNAVNLTDGLDGLCAGDSAISMIAIAYVAYIHGEQYGSSTVCLALTCLSGCCVGFLPFNVHPAKTFMGDNGSLYLGFMMSVFSIISPLKRATLVSTCVPLFAIALPIIDTLSSIVRRRKNGKPVMQADHGHLHHRIFAREGGQERSVVILYCITGGLSISAILMSRELYKESIALFGIVAALIYIFMTEPMPAGNDSSSSSEIMEEDKPLSRRGSWKDSRSAARQSAENTENNSGEKRSQE